MSLYHKNILAVIERKGPSLALIGLACDRENGSACGDADMGVRWIVGIPLSATA